MDQRTSDQVTIIIPIILRDDQDIVWLDEAVESAFSQTLKCQIIIVENGSSMLPDVVGDISIMHSDQGLSKARNAGVRASHTPFFFPLDGNDWLEPSAIETALARMPEKGFVYGATMLFSGVRGEGDQHFYEAKPYDFAEVMKMVYFPNGALQRKADWETIGGYPEDLPFLEDWDYWITAGEKGICGTAIPDLLYWYRQHGGIVQTHNKTPAWDEVKRQIRLRHKDIYRGVFPPMCCGNKNRPTTTTPVIGPEDAMAPGENGMVLIRYVGGNYGRFTMYGAVTNTRYVVNGAQSRLYIDERDAVTGSRFKPGFLEISEGGTQVFQRV